MKKNKLFMKYLLMNFCLIMVVLVGCVINVYYTYSLEKKNIIEENGEYLSRSIAEMEKTLNSAISVSQALRSNAPLTALARVSGDLPTDKYVLMNYLQEDLTSVQMIADIPAISFVLFKNNGVFVSNTQKSSDYDTYYGKYLQVEDMTAQEFKQELFRCSQRVTCMTYSEISAYSYRSKLMEDPIVIVTRITEADRVLNDTIAMAFLIDREDFYKRFFFEGNEENLICVCDNSGNILCTFGDNAEALKQFSNTVTEPDSGYKIGDSGYYLQQMSDSVVGNTIIIAVPTNQVKGRTLQLLKVNISVAALAILFGLFAAVYLSYRKSSWMLELIEGINRRTDDHLEKNFVKENEYQYIKKNVDLIADSRDTYQKDLKNLQLQMENSILEQMFLQEITSDKIRSMCQKILPNTLHYYYVIVIQCDQEDSVLLISAFHKLEPLLHQYIIDHDYLKLQTNVNEISYLIGIDHENLINISAHLTDLEKILQSLTELSGTTFHAGVSGIGEDVANIHTCYIQAKQALTCYSRENVNTIGYYAQLVNSTGNSLTNMDYVARLYQFLLSGNYELFNESLDKLLKHYRLNPYAYEKNIREIYFSIRHTLICAAWELSISEDVLCIQPWNSSIGLEAGIEQLKDSAGKLQDAYNEQKKSHNKELKENVIAYIQKNFTNSNITASNVCREMKISEKYLSQFLKEQTGKTFSKYIEDLRIEKAREYLDKTDLSNEKIAEAAGFGSLNSFYRVFNKKMGISPGMYRKRNE